MCVLDVSYISETCWFLGLEHETKKSDAMFSIFDVEKKKKKKDEREMILVLHFLNS